MIRLHRFGGAKYDGHISELPLNDSLIDCELTNDFETESELLNAAEAALRHAFTGPHALSA